MLARESRISFPTSGEAITLKRFYVLIAACIDANMFRSTAYQFRQWVPWRFRPLWLFLLWNFETETRIEN
jgi:hypothetical protein